MAGYCNGIIACHLHYHNNNNQKETFTLKMLHFSAEEQIEIQVTVELWHWCLAVVRLARPKGKVQLSQLSMVTWGFACLVQMFNNSSPQSFSSPILGPSNTNRMCCKREPSVGSPLVGNFTTKTWLSVRKIRPNHTLTCHVLIDYFAFACAILWWSRKQQINTSWLPILKSIHTM